MKSSKPTIGIIGGAGPMAGVCLAKRVVELLQREYCCVEDADFPRILLLSEPFCQMLRPHEQGDAAIVDQLASSLQWLIEAGADLIAIACNTLHAFLPEKSERYRQLLHLIKESEESIERKLYRQVLVLGSSTAAVKHLYRFKGAVWPSAKGQDLVNQLIYQILEGRCGDEQQALLRRIVNSELNRVGYLDAVLLGCSELSVLMRGCVEIDLPLIDPLDLMAERLCRGLEELEMASSLPPLGPLTRD